jgi:uncharacterized membrane protein YccC
LDRLALQAALRAGVAVSAGFALGRYVLDDDQLAIFAAFTAMALLAFADYGGPVRLRLAATAATVAVAFPLVALGTAASESAWGGPLAVGAAASVVAYSAVLGGYFAAGANAVVLFVVLAAGIPAPADALGPRLAGTALGGALAVAASGLMWPAPRGTPAGRSARPPPPTAPSCGSSSTSIACSTESPGSRAGPAPRRLWRSGCWTRPARPSPGRRNRLPAAARPATRPT